jgi:hypothetical protein
MAEPLGGKRSGGWIALNGDETPYARKWLKSFHQLRFFSPLLNDPALADGASR